MRDHPMAVIIRSAAANWWKFLVVGAAVLGAVIVASNIMGELGAMWLPMFVITLGSLATLATGLVLGIAHLIGGRRANSPS
jgi:hypothetical protein